MNCQNNLSSSATTSLHPLHLETDPIFRMHSGSKKEKVRAKQEMLGEEYPKYISMQRSESRKGREMND